MRSRSFGFLVEAEYEYLPWVATLVAARVCFNIEKVFFAAFFEGNSS